MSPVELAAIIRKMEAAGESPENIRLVVKHHGGESAQPAPPPEKSAAEKLAYAVGPSLGLDSEGLKRAASVAGSAGELQTGTMLDQLNPALLLNQLVGVGKGVGSTGVGLAKLANMLPTQGLASYGPEADKARAERASALESVRPKAAPGAEGQGFAGEQAAEFLVPGAAGTVEKAPGLLNLLTRALATGGEVAGVGAAQRGDFSHVGRDLALGAALPVGGKALEAGAGGLAKILPFVSKAAGVGAENPEGLASIAQTVIAALGGAGMLSPVAGGLRIPGAATVLGKGAGALERAASNETLAKILETISKEGPEGALGKLLSRGSAPAERAAVEPAAAVAEKAPSAAPAPAAEASAPKGAPTAYSTFADLPEPIKRLLNDATAKPAERQIAREAINDARKGDPTRLEHLVEQLQGKTPVAQATEQLAGLTPDSVAPQPQVPGPAASLEELLRRSIRARGGVPADEAAAAAPAVPPEIAALLLPDGQRAMAGGRSGLAVSPGAPRLSAPPVTASTDLEALLRDAIDALAKKRQ